jgi:shikimate kinase
MSFPFQNSLSLWGFMGSGKTHWGQRLAQTLCVPFVDLDQRIEARAGLTVAELFTLEGESGFRTRELEVLNEVLAQPGHFVLAVGGGTPCFFDNAERLRAHTLSVFLDVPPDWLAERLRSEKAQRPLLAEWPENEWSERLAALLERRRPFYEQAQLHCPVDHGFPLGTEDFLQWIARHQ